MEITRNKADKYQGLFNYLNEQYGINPTIEGMDDLILEVDKAKQLILSGVVGSGKTCNCGSGESNYHKKIGCRECC